jgi:hypothetical protein
VRARRGGAGGRLRDELLEHIGRHLLLDQRTPARRVGRGGGAPAEQRTLPRVILRAQRLRTRGEQRAHVIGHEERRRLGPAECPLGAREFLGAERLAVGTRGVLLLRAP